VINFSLQEVTQNLISQIGFLVLLIMVVRALIAYTREDWGQFWSGLTLGLCCLVVVFFGPQLQELAKGLGNTLFQ
jgi:predicted Na+-dependent transporter